MVVVVVVIVVVGVVVVVVIVVVGGIVAGTGLPLLRMLLSWLLSCLLLLVRWC